MLDDPLLATTPDPPTPEGRYLRGGCGFLFGALMAWCLLIRLAGGNLGFVVGASLVAGAAIAACSMRYGDRFWFSALEVLKGWWPRG